MAMRRERMTTTTTKCNLGDDGRRVKLKRAARDREERKWIAAWRRVVGKPVLGEAWL